MKRKNYIQNQIVALDATLANMRRIVNTSAPREEYLEQIKERASKEERSSTTREHDGILITSKLFIDRKADKCPVCHSFKMSNIDKVMIKKIGHCQRCEWKKN